MAQLFVKGTELFIVTNGKYIPATKIGFNRYTADARIGSNPSEPGDPGEPSTSFIAPFARNTYSDTWDTDYGERPGIGKGWHDGIDFNQGGIGFGSEIRCPANGRVIKTWNYNFNTYPGGNNGVTWPGIGIAISHGRIDGEGEFAGREIWTMYAHMQAPLRHQVGDELAQGDVVGILGSTGFSSGPHLHWEVHVDSFGNYTNDIYGSTKDPVVVVDEFGGNWGNFE